MKRFSRGTRTALTVMAFLVSALVAAPAAIASTTIGQTGTPNYAFTAGYENIQTAAAMPEAGVVTSFHTQSSACNITSGTYDFQVLRPLGSDQYLVVGDTGNKIDPCDSQLHSYPVFIPVQAGDVIGVYVVDAWQGELTPFSGGRVYASIPQPVAGNSITVPIHASGTIDESVTLTPPASAWAAKLVSDATGLKPGKALVDKATAIQTAVSAGDTDTACADITNFLGLVKAQTGKKLTHADASLLTTDATNLAAALGC